MHTTWDKASLTGSIFYPSSTALPLFWSSSPGLRSSNHTSSACPDWHWNAFDSIVVIAQVLSEFAVVTNAGMNIFRLVRLLRLLRIARLFRIIHLVVELRSIVSSIVGSFRSVLWALLLFLVMIFSFSILLTQIITDHRLALLQSSESDADASGWLAFHCSSLWSTGLILWAAISGGLDWLHLITPLFTDVSPLVAIVYILYIAFCIIAMMNVMTGIFVEQAMTNSQEDQDLYVARNVISVFKKSNLNEYGEITWQAFEALLETSELQKLFKSAHVDVSDARRLFKLIDTDDSGTVDPDELMNGWLRLKGTAKSIDLALLMRESARADAEIHDQLETLMSTLHSVHRMVKGQLPPGANLPSESVRRKTLEAAVLRIRPLTTTRITTKVGGLSMAQRSRGLSTHDGHTRAADTIVGEHLI